jgi:hypothetical protein
VPVSASRIAAAASHQNAQELRGEVLSLRSELKKEFLGSGEDPGA